VEEENNQGVATPTLHRHSGPSMVWLIPLITVLIGGWLVFKTLTEQGPRFTLAFETAEGIEADKTRIKYKNVDVGVVESLRFSNNFDHVILTVQMDQDTDHLLRRGTSFWVVSPRLCLRGVSGLGTLISGAYIELDPGKGITQGHFKGLETPPVLTTENEGAKVMLITPKLGSIGIGSPIYYQGILAGEVLGYELGDDQSSVLIHAFINTPYDDLLQGNSRFWSVSGLDVSVSADGINVRTESLESLMFGGIAFETPASLEPVTRDVSGLVFSLHPSYENIQESTYTQKIQFILFFQGSVRGLAIDAPVEFKGIKVGLVKDIRLEFYAEDTSFRIPVLVEIEPERIIKRNQATESATMDTVNILIDRGLRARLQTGSLLTGQLFVELVMKPDSEQRLVATDVKIPQLPTIQGEIEQVTSSIKGFLAKLDKVKLDQIATELEGTLAGTNKLLSHGDIKGLVTDLAASMASMKVFLAKLEQSNPDQIAVELEGTLAGINKFANHSKMEDLITDMAISMARMKGVLATLDEHAEPLSENLVKTLAALAPALDKARGTMTMIDGVLRPDSLLHYRVIQMADELAEAARSIRSFVNLLERNPESLIFGKDAPR